MSGIFSVGGHDCILTATAAPGDWITYHHDNARTGLAADLAPLGTLSPAWTATLDGAVYGQPLVVGDRVFAATENDTVYALDPATGAVVWSAHVGTPMPRSALPCGNIDPLGITSTMVYDPASDLLFALAERTGAEHVLVSIDATTGQVREQRPAEPLMGDRIAHQQRAAPDYGVCDTDTVCGGRKPNVLSRTNLVTGSFTGCCRRHVDAAFQPAAAGHPL